MNTVLLHRHRTTRRNTGRNTQRLISLAKGFRIQDETVHTGYKHLVSFIPSNAQRKIISIIHLCTRRESKGGNSSEQLIVPHYSEDETRLNAGGKH